MRNPQGYIIISGENGITERDTFSCGHCNRVVIVKPNDDPANAGGFCRQCMRLICPRCTASGRCTPLEKQIEDMEARGKFLRSIENA